MQSRYYIYMVFLCALFFVCGYKIGDASGYRDGYEYGYRFDCKEEIGDLYKQVKNQSQALKYTDSAIKIVSHLNDSLMRKEYFQKRFQDSVKWRENFSNDSVQLFIRFNQAPKKIHFPVILNNIFNQTARNFV